jgi:hypothetical protein
MNDPIRQPAFSRCGGGTAVLSSMTVAYHRLSLSSSSRDLSSAHPTRDSPSSSAFLKIPSQLPMFLSKKDKKNQFAKWTCITVRPSFTFEKRIIDLHFRHDFN